jgi:glycosyltransferase involved in cell wall biosynthesis
MNIALLHYTAPPVVGGVESVMGHQARLMADAGHAVRIVAGRGGPPGEYIEFAHVPLADSRHPEVMQAQGRLDGGHVPDQFQELVQRLLEALAKALSGTDCLIAHNVCSLNKNLALTAALHHIAQQGKGPRMILWHHDLAWTAPRYRKELHDGYPWNLLRSAWPGVRQVTISEFRRRELADLFGIPEDTIRVVPNGIEVAGFLKLEEQTQRFVRRLQLTDAYPLLLLPVRITPRKNIELALRVLTALRGHFPGARLVVTGPLGPHSTDNRSYFDKLAALRAELRLQGAAHFLAEISDEFLPDQVISDFYRLADALLLPSREEGFGIPILEAGLTGIPVFCADIPPLRELGEDLVHYFLPDGDPSAVAAEIIRCLDADATLALRQRVRSRYTWEQVYQQAIDPLLEEG